MSLFKKKSKDEDQERPLEQTSTASAYTDVDVGTAADVEALMKKYDRESNVRIWEGTPKLVIRWLMVAFSVYSIWVTLFSNAMP